jgi:kynurenine formamidase
VSGRLVDLSHEVVSGEMTYPGLPAPVVDDHLSWEDSHGRYPSGTEFQIGRISMVGNTETYLDTPAHRYRDGFGLSALPLEAVVDLPGVLVRASGRAVGESFFAGVPVTGRAVLIHTGWDRHWATAQYGAPEHPFLTARAAEYLAGAGVALVGIDSVNIDDTSADGDGSRPAHTVLLGAGVPIVEHLCGLEALSDRPFTFTAVPVKVRDLATFPVRAFARQETEAG